MKQSRIFPVTLVVRINATREKDEMSSLVFSKESVIYHNIEVKTTERQWWKIDMFNLSVNQVKEVVSECHASKAYGRMSGNGSITSNRQENIDKKNQYKLIQCLKAFMNNKFGLQRILEDERSLLLLARAIDPKQPNMMTEIVKILSAICIVGEENILDKLLGAITTAAERNNRERFSPIVEGLENHEALQLQLSIIFQFPPYCITFF
ncbi:Protein diaphanous like protein 2 [Tupaia chinensis]|uniref:Protein diaphanous like protein 2 n=1 Tax=Tupaia chinensis TaxID=246437 RepID=L8YAD6_TUPCH|nr:Protein diaphanous like protein 2 [Tupaia chinensis]